MGRPTRHTYPGARHHVFNRAAGRQPLFHDDIDRKVFVGLVREIHDRFGVVVHAFCLMGNHYHLALHTPLGQLSEAMAFHASAYTRFFNRRHGRDGPLFRARFCSTHVADDGYLLELTRYVHRNPLDLRPPVDLASYRWSSFPAFLDRRRRPAWLDADLVLAIHGTTADYRSYVVKDRPGEASGAPSIDPRSRFDEGFRTCVDTERVLEAVERALDRCAADAPLPCHPRAVKDPARTKRMAGVAAAAALGVDAAAIGERFGYRSAATVRSALHRSKVRSADDALFRAFVQLIAETAASQAAR